ncbi:MAG: hypothetical protein OK439_00640 [Thaumarchaeota archaeon]|nr:hypothetical protein [Nitrososphaerota archaeon]
MGERVTAFRAGFRLTRNDAGFILTLFHHTISLLKVKDDLSARLGI